MNTNDLDGEGNEYSQMSGGAEDALPSSANNIRAQRNDRLFGALLGGLLLVFLGTQFLLNDKPFKQPVVVATTVTNGYANIFSVPSNQSVLSTNQDKTTLALPPPVMPLPHKAVKPAPTATAVPKASPRVTPIPPTSRPLATPAPTPTLLPVPTPTATQAPTPSPTAIPTPIVTPSSTPVPTPTVPSTPSPTATGAPTSIATPIATASVLP